MSGSRPETSDIVAAFASRANLELTPSEHARLNEYVLDVWDMADRLRAVTPPGLEGAESALPRRAAYANREPSPSEAAALQSWTAAKGTVRGSGESAAPESLELGLVEVAQAYAAGTFTPLAFVRATLERLDRYDPTIRSSVTIDREGAMAAAQVLTQELSIAEGPRSLLHGVPIGAKDSIPAFGMPCTFNSPFMRRWMPKRDAEAVRRVRAAGAVMVAKHNLNEFGWSIPTEKDLTPPPRNPWLPEEYSVGSTSGGGAAVASRFAVAALGTDGGGSIRLPAAQHLLFGLKPGHGRVPPQGVTEGRVSEVSILARKAEDVAAVLAVLDIDPEAAVARDRLRREPRAHVDHVLSTPHDLRIVVPQGYVDDVAGEEDVLRLFGATCDAIRTLGHSLDVLPKGELAILHDAVRANFVVIAAEHYFDHEETGKDRRHYGESAGFYNLPGACLTAADYQHALRVGEMTRNAVDAVLQDADLLLTPTSPVTRSSTARNPKTHRRGGNAAYTSPFNITGHPAISFPVGLSAEGMPIGMQLVGRPGSEFELIRAARALSETFDLPPFPDLDEVVSFVQR
ncbi:MAG: amidase [Trueperaceae bacterium]